MFAFLRAFFLVFAAGLAVVGCAPASTARAIPCSASPSAPSPNSAPAAISTPALNPTPSVVPTVPNSLRAMAITCGIEIGTAVDVDALRKDPQYAATLAREYSIVVAENAMKWKALRPSQSTYNFDDADYLVSFARAHGMQIRGHNLVWGIGNPDWLAKGNFTRDQLVAILYEHINTVVSRYRGKIAAWDVVNEALDSQTDSLGDTLWLKGIGPDYVDMAFKFAREADPNVKLIYNDYGDPGLSKRGDAIYALVKGLKDRGVPIDGVGFQSHFTLDAPQMQGIDANMKRYRALGLDVEITELDVRIPVPAAAADLTKQAQIYHDYTQTCLANDNCKMIVTWGFTDKYSWIPSAYPGFGAGLPFDEHYQPKAAYGGLIDALAGR